MIGHIIPVPSETGASDGDYEDEYIIARYRIYLSEAEYKPILATMREWQGSTPLWHAAVYNCNAFVGSVARHMGLETQNPVVAHLQLPKDYVEGIRDLNGAKMCSAPGQPMVAAAPNKHQQVAGVAPARARAAAPRPSMTAASLTVTSMTASRRYLRPRRRQLRLTRSFARKPPRRTQGLSRPGKGVW